MQHFSEAALHWGYLALHQLQWSVEEFWQATPQELRMGLVSPTAPHSPLGRAALEMLIAKDIGEKSYG